MVSTVLFLCVIKKKKEKTLCYITNGNNVNMSCNPLMRHPEFIMYSLNSDRWKMGAGAEKLVSLYLSFNCRRQNT